MSVLLVIFWGLVVLIALIVVHELGHFIAARAFGVRVTEFMIGMPGPNIGFVYKGCKFGITCIPLGGYNRITGMEGGPENPHLARMLAYVYRQGKVDVEHAALACGLDEEDAQEALTILDEWGSINKPGRCNKTGFFCAPETDEYALGQPRLVEDEIALLDSERAQTYRGLCFWKRLVVLFAGPLMNLLLAAVIFLVLFSAIGLPYSSNTVDSTIPDTPAAEVLQAGDVITAVNGVQTQDLSEISTALANLEAGDSITLTIERDGVVSDVVVVPEPDEDGNLKVGFYAAVARKHLNVGKTLYIAGYFTWETIKAYAKLFNPVTTAETVSQSTSIVGISVMAKQAASAGAYTLFYLIAAVSLSLGIVNLVILPPLDGGKILVEVIEKIARRQIPVKVVNMVSFAVMALFLILFVFLLQQDIGNIING